MKILIVNCGSSSLKYQVMNMENEEILAKGKCDRIGTQAGNMASSFIEYKKRNDDKIIEELPLKDHIEAFKILVKYLTDDKVGIISDLNGISAVGHRAVSGGPYINGTTLINAKILEDFEKAIPYAPLHNPPAIQGIKACIEIMKNIPQVLVFDTSFHQTMPKKAYTYAIPEEYTSKYGIRRYGFHGMSHQYVTEVAANMLGKDINNVNIISCHLGNGSSITAIKNGKSVDTSMGFTPLEGLVMGTRSGDIDPAITEFIMEREKELNINDFIEILNKKSGLYAITGNVTADIRDIKKMKLEGDEKAKLAIDILTYKIRKYIGSYMAVLGHVDAITFEGGIGENNQDIIYECIGGLEEFDIIYDIKYIDNKQHFGFVNAENSKIKIIVIPTNEELIIARETMNKLNKKSTN